MKSKPRVLFVDDEESNTRLYCIIAEHEGFQCLECHDVIFACNLIDMMPIDIVCTDYRFAYHDGSILLKYIRSFDHNSRIKVIAITGSSVDEVPELKEFDAYLQKPISRISLVRVLKKFSPKST